MLEKFFAGLLPVQALKAALEKLAQLVARETAVADLIAARRRDVSRLGVELGFGGGDSKKLTAARAGLVEAQAESMALADAKSAMLAAIPEVVDGARQALRDDFLARKEALEGKVEACLETLADHIAGAFHVTAAAQMRGQCDIEICAILLRKAGLPVEFAAPLARMVQKRAGRYEKAGQAGVAKLQALADSKGFGEACRREYVTLKDQLGFLRQDRVNVLKLLAPAGLDLSAAEAAVRATEPEPAEEFVRACYPIRNRGGDVCTVLIDGTQAEAIDIARRRFGNVVGTVCVKETFRRGAQVYSRERVVWRAPDPVEEPAG